MQSIVIITRFMSVNAYIVDDDTNTKSKSGTLLHMLCTFKEKSVSFLSAKPNHWSVNFISRNDAEMINFNTKVT